MFENQEFEKLIGNPHAPYINSLAKQYGLATNLYANTHPSIGDYFMLTTGSIVTNDL
jgi:acid phosphatase